MPDNLSSNSNREIMLGVARELYGRVAWTHKTHEKEREIWSKKVHSEKWWNIFLVALTTILATLGAVFDDRSLFIFTSVTGAISTGLLIYQLSFNTCKIESDQRSTAKKLLVIRDKYLILISI